MKTCKICKVDKELSEFPINKSNKTDGHNARCKVCRKAYTDNWVRDNRIKSRAYSKKWRGNNLEAAREYDKEYCKKNREKKTANFKSWRHRNPEKVKASNKKHYAAQFQWLKDHPEVTSANALRRRQAERNAYPKWLSKEQKEEIKNIYKSARTRSEFHEIDFHVDHIEPIKGVNAEGVHVSCGLHVPWNLQVLPASENIRKSNKLYQPNNQ